MLAPSFRHRMLACLLVLAGAGDPLAPTAAPDQALAALTSPRILFQSYRIGSHPDIYMMDAQGNNSPGSPAGRGTRSLRPGPGTTSASRWCGRGGTRRTSGTTISI